MGVERQRTGLKLGSGSEPALELPWWKRGIRDAGLPADVVETILSARAPSTRRSYALKLGVARYTDVTVSVRTSFRGSRFDTISVQHEKKKSTMLGFFSFILNRQ